MESDDMMDTDMAITPVTSYPQLDNFSSLNFSNNNNNNNISTNTNTNATNAPKPINTQHLPHLNLRNRTDSLISIDTTYTTYTVRTNIDQNNNQQNNLQHNFNRNRQNSTASLSSSVFSEMPPPQLENYDFTTQFDDELYSYYIAYSQQPNITPFDIRYPPSGILSLISKLFLENNILDGEKIQIDSRLDINNDILLDSNRHKVLAIIRLRLIQLSNKNLNSNDDTFMFNDQFPISRTNSIASAISLGDRVLPQSNSNYMQSNNDLNSQPQIPAPMVHRPSWLHMPTLYANKDNSSVIPSSTDSLIDRVPLNISTNNNNSFQDPIDLTNSNDSQSSINVGSGKRERPSLNLHMPSFLKYRSMNNTSLQPRPQFSTGPLTPGTPNTPTTPVTNTTLQRNPPRSARSGSLSNPTLNYFSAPPTGNNPPITPVGFNKSTLSNSVLNHPQHPQHPSHANHNFSSPSNIDLQSPFEQAFPSPLTFGVPTSQLTNEQGSSSVNYEPSTTTPTTPATAGPVADLYNATVARKRDSLNLKRGLN
ncbi:hypothetical protein C6P40_000835 [Pichia californica]|uniref:Uncharacterized protein n=1 Tax=Pichia californica TaxID=460514 RepID=A0A9P6WM43_9ASCO|nr:hypothetical protein C6P42_000886 [[Candida] californica]KAG0688558.1 hypothetical protein C6P40_000835 [[Candida] californica]